MTRVAVIFSLMTPRLRVLMLRPWKTSLKHISKRTVYHAVSTIASLKTPLERRGNSTLVLFGFLKKMIARLTYIFSVRDSRKAHRMLAPVIAFSIALIPVAFSAEMKKENEYSKYIVKAVFVYNFLRFTEWPARNQSAQKVCITDPSNSYHQVFEKLARKDRSEPELNVEHFNDANTNEMFKRCQLIFFAYEDLYQEHVVLKKLKGLNILTIGEDPYFLRHGRMVRLVHRDHKICFDVNLKALKGSELRVTSRLLRLADKVVER